MLWGMPVTLDLLQICHLPFTTVLQCPLIVQGSPAVPIALQGSAAVPIARQGQSCSALCPPGQPCNAPGH